MIEIQSGFTRAQASEVRERATRCAAAPRIVRADGPGAIGRSSTDLHTCWHATCEWSISAGGLLPAIAVGGSNVDSDRIEGPLKEAGGKVKEELGDATDDASTEAEGKVEQAEGKLQNEWGEAKDNVRDAVDDDR
jgi:uncharacterized protein YjbJ (UPF0337 family)